MLTSINALLNPYVLGMLIGIVALGLIANKYGLIGLLILTAPIQRLFIQVGFALKPLYVVIAIMIFMNIWKKRGVSLTITTNRYFQLVFFFLLSVLVSAIANGAPITSLRHIVVFVFVFSGCYLLYGKIKSREDIHRLVNIYLFTGLILGLSGLMFYAIYFVSPERVVLGSVLEGVAYDVERSWVLPQLQSVDVGSNGYAMSLLPFLFVALGSALAPGARGKKLYAALIFALLFANLILTFSRGGVISFLVAATGMIFFVRGHNLAKWCGIVASLVLLLAFSRELLEIYEAYSFLKGAYSGDVGNLLSSRDRLFWASLNVFLDHPLFGVGQGLIGEDQFVGKQSHNTYIELLAENGIITFSIFIILMGFLFQKIIYLYRRIDSLDMYYAFLSFTFAMVALLIAAIPTSAITISLFWIQITVIVAMSRIGKAHPVGMLGY